jgi:spore germination protein YaaH
MSDGITHRRCGWIAVEDPANSPGTVSFQNHAGYFNVIHPVFWDISLPPNNNNNTVVPPPTQLDANLIFQIANGSGTRVWPMIAGPQDNSTAQTLATKLHDPAWRNRHIQDILEIVLNDTRGNVTGVDLDYEHLASVNDLQTTANDFRAFLTDLTNQAHAIGKKVSVTVNASAWNNRSCIPREFQNNRDLYPYHYVPLAQIVDNIHVMCYDFHYYKGPHNGPVSPKGWVSDVVSYINSTGSAQKFIYAFPNYGLLLYYMDAIPKWSSANLNTFQKYFPSQNYQTSSNHMASCKLGCELNGNYVWYLPGERIPNSEFLPTAANLANEKITNDDISATAAVPPRRVVMYFDDIGSLTDGLQLATNAGLGGCCYWSLGDELDGFFERVRSIFPDLTT